MGKDFELRLVSLVIRARELADDVVLLDLGSNDSTIEMANKVDCRVINHEGAILVPTLGQKCVLFGFLWSFWVIN